MRLIALIIAIGLLPLMALLCAFLAVAYPFLLISDRRAERRERKRARLAWSMPMARGTLLVWSGDLVGVN